MRPREFIGRLKRWGSRTLVRLLRYPPLALVYRTVRELNDDDATHMAAGVAYYAILSLFPLTIGLLAVINPVLESETVKAELLHFFQTYLPGSADTLEANLESTEGIRGILGIIGLLGMFWTASAIFGAISRAVNRAWDIHQDRPFHIDKLHHLAMAFGVGLLFLLSLSATTALQFVDSFDVHVTDRVQFLENAAIGTVARALPLLFSFGIFLVIYKFIPNTKTYWRHVWPGAALAAVLFEVGKGLFLFYLDNFADYQRIYGSLGSVVVLLSWTYASSFILLIGAEFSSEYERMRKGIARGQVAAKKGGKRRPGARS